MSSFTVTFTGTSSALRADFFPEIVLDPNGNYVCALLDFTAYNSIPNIVEGNNNKFEFTYDKNVEKWDKVQKKYVQKTEQKKLSISLPTGAYEVEDILKYLKWELDVHKISLAYEISAASSSIGISFDTNIEWTSGTILNVIGFENQKSFKTGEIYTNDQIVKITNIDLIRVECDIALGAYINGKQSHTIHQFSHCNVDPGYKFIEVPRHLIYLPIKEKELRSIQISIVDQNGHLVDFRGEQISCRIHIKKTGAYESYLV